MTVSSKQPAPGTVPGLGPEEIRDLCQEGVTACRQGQWEQGVKLLHAVIATIPTATEIPSLAYSFLGYGGAVLGTGYKDSVRLCDIGIRMDPSEAENYLNLARTCLLRGRRTLAVMALNRGLQKSPRHPELLELRNSLGRRRPPVVPFLHRDRAINRFLGKLRSRYVIKGPSTHEGVPHG